MKLGKLFSLAMLLAVAVVMSAPLAYSHCGMCGTDDAHEEKSSIDGHAHDAEGMVKEGYEAADEVAEDAEDALSSMAEM